MQFRLAVRDHLFTVRWAEVRAAGLVSGPAGSRGRTGPSALAAASADAGRAARRPSQARVCRPRRRDVPLQLRPRLPARRPASPRVGSGRELGLGPEKPCAPCFARRSVFCSTHNLLLIEIHFKGKLGNLG